MFWKKLCCFCVFIHLFYTFSQSSHIHVWLIYHQLPASTARQLLRMSHPVDTTWHVRGTNQVSLKAVTEKKVEFNVFPSHHITHPTPNLRESPVRKQTDVVGCSALDTVHCPLLYPLWPMCAPSTSWSTACCFMLSLSRLGSCWEGGSSKLGLGYPYVKVSKADSHVCLYHPPPIPCQVAPTANQRTRRVLHLLRST